MRLFVYDLMLVNQQAALHDDQLEAERQDKYFDYLDALRFSCVTNMFGATPYLTDEFPELSKLEARQVLAEWMRDFGKEESDG